MKAEIKEKTPGGQTGYAVTLRWLKNIGKSTDNLKGVWSAIEPEIKQSLKYEFSKANPNNWLPISEEWIKWKLSHNYPRTIGIRTGTLKKSLTDSAIIKKGKKKLNWMANSGMVAHPFKESVGEYGASFGALRPIFTYTRKFVKSILKKATLKQMDENRGVRNV